MAEDKSNFGKIVKRAIREMWALEYEVDELQHKFADSIRNRQITKLEEIKKTYGDAIKDLEPMKVTRPPKTEPAKPADKPAEAAPAAPAPEAAKA